MSVALVTHSPVHLTRATQRVRRITMAQPVGTLPLPDPSAVVASAALGGDQRSGRSSRSGKSVRNRLWSRREVKIRHRGSPRNHGNGPSQLVCPQGRNITVPDTYLPRWRSEGAGRDVLRGLADGNTGMMRTSAGGLSPTYAFLETAQHLVRDVQVEARVQVPGGSRRQFARLRDQRGL